jgi:hypothetical protein
MYRWAMFLVWLHSIGEKKFAHAAGAAAVTQQA